MATYRIARFSIPDVNMLYRQLDVLIESKWLFSMSKRFHDVKLKRLFKLMSDGSQTEVTQ